MYCNGKRRQSSKKNCRAGPGVTGCYFCRFGIYWPVTLAVSAWQQKPGQKVEPDDEPVAVTKKAPTPTPAP